MSFRRKPESIAILYIKSQNDETGHLKVKQFNIIYMKKRRRKKLHPTGQLSIFAILMFQMLFILFAMSLNVALVVHDKINLQNSADLAAYYGAMKQAEMMNAIAHINYQIRQSWKLFVWRYRVLGNIGVAQVQAPYRRASPMSGARGQDRKVRPFPPDPYGREGPYFFCVGHQWWGVFDNNSPNGISMPAGNTDKLCLNIGFSVGNRINPISIPDVRGVLGSFANLMLGTRAVSIRINATVSKRCSLYGYNSWLLGVFSVIYFRRDQSVRKYMIKKLAETIQAGKDLDGGSIDEGVENTFKKNLNFINKQNAQGVPLKKWNSLNRPGVQVNQWLTDAHHKVDTDVLYAKLDGHIGSIRGCNKRIEYLQHPPTNSDLFITPARKDELVKEIHYSGYDWPINCTENQCDSSAGISKNPEFYVFYAVEAELDYKNQIFLPGGRNLKLKAQAFAKPFGGRIGPPENADSILGDDYELRWAPKPLPNYSRYPGDNIGLRSDYTQHQWRFIQGVDKMQKNVLHYMKREKPNDPDPLMRTIYGSSGEGRKWEMRAIAPDLFDVSYFTILPYYQHTYFKKVKARVGIGNRARGDLGYVGADTHFQSQSILNQINRPSSPVPQLRNLNLFYKIKNEGNRLNEPALLLTGWNPPMYKYFDVNIYGTNRPTNFGKCYKWANSSISQPKGKIANGCVYGGRSGYSVKMISKNYICGFDPQANQRLPDCPP